MVSLITCTPYGLNTKRLVVTGERIPYTEKQEQEIVPGSMSFRELVFTALPFLYLVVGIGSMIRKKRGKRSTMKHKKIKKLLPLVFSVIICTFPVSAANENIALLDELQTVQTRGRGKH